MEEESGEIRNLNRHYTVEEVFRPKTKQVRGFIEKNYHKGLHSQAFYEINIVLSGEACHYIGKRRITVREGDVFIIPPDVLHGYDGGEGFDVYHILISPTFLERHAAELQVLPSFSSLFRIDPLLRENTSARLHFRLTGEEIGALRGRLDALTESSQAPGCESVTQCLIACGEAMILIARLCEIYDGRVGALRASDGDDAALAASISYMCEHIGEAMTVETLARRAQMSRSAYIAAIKRVTGLTPARFLRRQRVETARQMLDGTALSEAEIASAVGFSDTSHLIKVFTAALGVTPSAYRKRETGGDSARRAGRPRHF